MDVDVISRILMVLLFSLCETNCIYVIPDVRIQAFKPKGFKAYIPDSPDVTLFAFHGNINKEIEKNAIGTLNGEVLEPVNGRWTIEDQNAVLEVGDLINYYVFISAQKKGHVIENLSFTVTDLIDPTTKVSSEKPISCKPSVTTVRGVKACAGQIIFEDNFFSFRDNIWELKQELPNNHPEYPFVSYQNRDEVIKIQDGNLRIQPTLLQLLPGYSNDSIQRGTLNLFNGCSESGESCFMEARGADILPPVVSGRVSSRSFSFRYGIVKIRAKLPQGDWLYPEILLEPLLNKYGKQHFASGMLKIAAARGNKDLSLGNAQFGNEVLYGGAVMDFNCHDALLRTKTLTDGRKWGDDFHNYTLLWEPGHLVLSVDGEEWGHIEEGAKPLRTLFTNCTDAPHHLWAMGAKMAPFDQEFYLTLGVAAGGITEFKNSLYTIGGRPKPWSNLSNKAKLNFWQDLDAWYRTWDTNSALIVDSVKVIAL